MGSETFDPKRFFRLVKLDLALNAGWILPGAAVFFCLMSAGSLSGEFLSGEKPRAPYFFAFVLFVGGLVLTSLAFAELGDRRKIHGFLLLPCSALEKYLSRYVLTSWVYVAASLAEYSGFIVLAQGVNAFFGGQPFSYSGCFNPRLVHLIIAYLVVHPVFLAGAVYFKKQAFLKTLVAIFALPFSLMGFVTVLTRILYHNTIFSPDLSFRWFTGSLMHFLMVISLITRWPFLALPPLLLVIGYLRLKEREAADGV